MRANFIFVLALLAFGATIGAIHALTISSTSGSVIELLAAIIAASLGLYFVDPERKGRAGIVSRVTPQISGVVLSILIGYWIGWGALKFSLHRTFKVDVSDFDDRFTHLTNAEKADANRLIAISSALGVPASVSKARVLDIVPVQGSDRTCLRLNDQEKLASLYDVAGVLSSCSASRHAELARDIRSVYGQYKAGDRWEVDFEKVWLDARYVIAASGGLREAALGNGCGDPPVIDDTIALRLAVLDDLLVGCVPDLETELVRVLRNAPKLSVGDLRQLGIVNEKGNVTRE